MRSAHPDALPIAGGTDVMVELNFDRRRPERMLDLTRVARAARTGSARTAACASAPGVTYTRIIDELGDAAARPGDRLAHRRLAADPQPRHGGRQPGHRLAGRRRAPAPGGRRRRGRARVGPRAAPGAGRGLLHRAQAQRPARRRADRRRRPAGRRAGRSSSARSAPRNAMVIAVCSFALALDPPAPHGRHRHRLGRPHGDRAPARPRRSWPGLLDEGGLLGVARAAGRVRARPASASWSRRRRRPIDDVRGTRGLPPARARRAGAADADLGVGRATGSAP